MKKQFLITMLLASFLLASCGNNMEENDVDLNDNEEYYQNEIDENEEYDEYDSILNNNLNLENTPINTIDENLQNQTNEQMLATYSTSLGGSSDERINNLEIVCDRLNNYILKPSETFSYNDVTGPFGPDDGFEEAPIMLKNGEKTEGYGGGVCQLSSTLYNVVKDLDNVEITERHHHSSPVSYVPKGEDATVSLQSGLDFKFINNANYPIIFKAKCENNEVTVWAYKTV